MLAEFDSSGADYSIALESSRLVIPAQAGIQLIG